MEDARCDHEESNPSASFDEALEEAWAAGRDYGGKPYRDHLAALAAREEPRRPSDRTDDSYEFDPPGLTERAYENGYKAGLAAREEPVQQPDIRAILAAVAFTYSDQLSEELYERLADADSGLVETIAKLVKLRTPAREDTERPLEPLCKCNHLMSDHDRGGECCRCHCNHFDRREDTERPDGELTYSEMEEERDRLARELYEAQERICGAISASGPGGEPLACAYRPDHEGAHSWATLPTFVRDTEPSGNSIDLTRMHVIVGCADEATAQAWVERLEHERDAALGARRDTEWSNENILGGLLALIDRDELEVRGLSTDAIDAAEAILRDTEQEDER